MHPSSRLQSLLLCAGLVGAGSASITAQQNVDEKIVLELRKVEAGPLERAFAGGLALLDGLPEVQDDTIARGLVQAAEKIGFKGKLAAATALRELDPGDVYGSDLLAILKPVSETDDTEAQIAALEMLGDERRFNIRVMPDVRDLLRERAKSELVAPRVRLTAAKALWEVGTNEDRELSRDTLEQFLRSADRKLQIAGALALAATNSEPTGAAWDLLREVAQEPTPEGQQAQLFVKLDQQRREFESFVAQVHKKQLESGDSAPTDANEFRVLTELMRRIQAQHVRGESFTDEELLEFAAKGMMSGLDRHSTFFSSDEFQRFFFDLNREYGGIGAFVNFDQDGDFSIVRPIYSGPAYGAGLRSGDKILAVDGWETNGHTDQEIIKRLKGKPGTDVEVRIYRPGMSKPEELTIERRQIAVPSVNATMIPGGIGYIELVNFSQNTALELESALAHVIGEGAEGLVLDMRNNTGGYLLAARDVVEKFVEGRKLVVFTKDRLEGQRDYKTRDRALTQMPLTVLINGLSASASEITAGALQDHGRAYLVGTRSFGKGSVQSLVPLRSLPGEELLEDENNNGTWDQGEPFEDRNGNGKFDVGAHLKMTIAKYYLPSGRSLHKEFDKEGRIINPGWGVTPDLDIEVRDQKPSELWKNAALFDLVRKGSFRGYVEDRIEANGELFLELAEGDGGDVSRYPDFEEFFAGLDTKLDKDDVRRWVRYEIRDAVADLRGKVYPGNRALGDFQEDAQLQGAVRWLLDQLGKDIRNVAAYKDVLKLEEAKSTDDTKPAVGSGG